jgi:hypothetical protein
MADYELLTGENRRSSRARYDSFILPPHILVGLADSSKIVRLLVP